MTLFYERYPVKELIGNDFIVLYLFCMAETANLKRKVKNCERYCVCQHVAKAVVEAKYINNGVLVKYCYLNSNKENIIDFLE